MKTVQAILLIALLTLCFGCKNEGLDSATAERLIRESERYPRAAEEMIFTGDMQEAKRLLDLDMESTGMVKITQRQTSSEFGNPWITFTEKGKAYLLPTPQEDTKYKRQNVKVADIDFDKIQGIVMTKDGKAALVRYTTIYKNLTPFWKMYKNGSNKPVERKAYFVRYDSGWHHEKKPGALMMQF